MKTSLCSITPNNKINVLYRRRDGTYGLIDPP